jgi:hypothetical protein
MGTFSNRVIIVCVAWSKEWQLARGSASVKRDKAVMSFSTFELDRHCIFLLTFCFYGISDAARYLFWRRAGSLRLGKTPGKRMEAVEQEKVLVLLEFAASVARAALRLFEVCGEGEDAETRLLHLQCSCQQRDATSERRSDRERKGHKARYQARGSWRTAQEKSDRR